MWLDETDAVAKIPHGHDASEAALASDSDDDSLAAVRVAMSVICKRQHPQRRVSPNLACSFLHNLFPL